MSLSCHPAKDNPRISRSHRSKFVCLPDGGKATSLLKASLYPVHPAGSGRHGPGSSSTPTPSCSPHKIPRVRTFRTMSMEFHWISLFAAEILPSHFAHGRPFSVLDPIPDLFLSSTPSERSGRSVWFRPEGYFSIFSILFISVRRYRLRSLAIFIRMG